MLSERERARAIRLAGVDVLIQLFALAIAYWVRNVLFIDFIGRELGLGISAYLWLVAWAIPVYGFLLLRAGAYEIDPTRPILSTLATALKPFAIGSLVLGTIIFLVQAKEYSRSIFFLFSGITFFGMILTRWAAIRYLRGAVAGGRGVRYALIVGCGPEAQTLARALTADGRLGMKVLGHLGSCTKPMLDTAPVLGKIEDLEHILDQHVVDEVILALPLSEMGKAGDLIRPCEERGVTVHLLANIISGHISNALVNVVAGLPLISLRSTPHHARDIVLKRAMDLLISAFALAILSLPMAVVALFIWLDTGAPILFKQKRKGLNGRTFTLYKFRSMLVGQTLGPEELRQLNEMSGPVFKSRNDPRVTRVGKVIRHYSLDELPQLWNVFRGDMSLVGPRPPLAEEVAQYTGWQRRRLSIKPGITCLWQVSGRSQIDFDRWMELDLHYINHWSLMLDLEILLRTVPAVLTAKGAR